MKITFNKTNLKKINQTMQDILLDTAEAVKTDLIQSQTMPFDSGVMQNDSTFVDDKRIIKGIVSLVTDTLYARKVYFDPEINIKLGTKYFSTLYETYKNIPIALTAYNAGSGNVDKWLTEETISKDGSDIENIPFRETNNYVRKILRDYEIYKDIYAEE